MGGGTDTEIRVSTESWPWRRKFSRRSSRDSNPQPFNHESGALTTELSPSPFTMSLSVFRGWIPWQFSLSKINIFPAAPDLELILYLLWYWPVMNAHTKTRQSVWNRFYWLSKSDPPFAHLLALSHRYFLLLMTFPSRCTLCVLVQRFEPQGRRITNFHYYYYRGKIKFV